MLTRQLREWAVRFAPWRKSKHGISKISPPSSGNGLKEHSHQVLWSHFEKCGNRSKLEKGAVSQILFLIYNGVNGTVETYSCWLEADNSKTMNPTEKIDTLGERRQVWLQLWKISLFLSEICGWDHHAKRKFHSPSFKGQRSKTIHHRKKVQIQLK